MQDKMTHDTGDAFELASALADGELLADEFGPALALLEADAVARERWHTYHLIGDVLRAGAGVPVAAHDPEFTARLRRKLEDSPVRPIADAQPRLPSSVPSANDRVWRWKLVAGLSTLTAAAVLGWQLVGDRSGSAATPQLALQQPVQAVADADAAVMIRDPRLDQWLAAHQQLGGSSALQVPAGFLRNATFERPAR